MCATVAGSIGRSLSVWNFRVFSFLFPRCDPRLEIHALRIRIDEMNPFD